MTDNLTVEGSALLFTTRTTYTMADVTHAHRRCAELGALHPSWPQARVRKAVAGEMGVGTTQLRYLLRRVG